MANVAKWLTHLVVVQACAGSIPVIRPIFFIMLVVSKSENETISQIINFFSKNKIPSLILLEGDVGTGKTIIVKAIAEYLNIEDNITSPSFGIKKTYNGLIHYDLYFKNNNLSKEFYTLINEDLEDNVVVIE